MQVAFCRVLFATELRLLLFTRVPGFGGGCGHAYVLLTALAPLVQKLLRGCSGREGSVCRMHCLTVCFRTALQSFVR
jgi:hypothetical protein